MLKRLRQMFCKHEWQMTRFQPLVPGRSVECLKCGANDHQYDTR